jgi:predicted nucleic acid-binding protein
VTTLLLDSRVLLAAFDPDDDNHEPSSGLLLDGETTLATLDLARYEVANVAVRAWRAPESVAPLLAAVEQLADDGGVLASTTSLLTRAAEIAEAHSISVYDAAYVAAAEAAETWFPRTSRRFPQEPATFRALSRQAIEGARFYSQTRTARTDLRLR